MVVKKLTEDFRSTVLWHPQMSKEGFIDSCIKFAKSCGFELIGPDRMLVGPGLVPMGVVLIPGQDPVSSNPNLANDHIYLLPGTPRGKSPWRT